MYIQRNDGPVTMAPGDSDVKNPYIETARELKQAKISERKASATATGRNGSIGVRKESQANIMDLLTSLDNGT